MTCLLLVDLGSFDGVPSGLGQSADHTFAPRPNKVYNVVCGKNCSLPGAYNVLAPLVGFDNGPAFAPARTAIFSTPSPLSWAKHYLTFNPAVGSAGGSISS
jgi:hypothetical protein